MINWLIRSRRSIRRYNGKKIPEDLIYDIIEAGVWAPSGCNNQEIRFLPVTDEKTLSELTRFKPVSKGCSCFIMVFYDMECDNSRIYDRFPQMALPFIDAGLAMQNMVLVATENKVVSCICNLTPYHSERLKNVSLVKRIWLKTIQTFGFMDYSHHSLHHYLHKNLGVPLRYHIIGGVILGYPSQKINLETATHGFNMVKRRPVDNYLIQEVNC